MSLINKNKWLSLLVLLATFFPIQADAQYYSWGADRASLRWSKIKGERFDVVYPDSAELPARALTRYVEAVQPYISYGFNAPPLDMPFVVHPDNMHSNGMVMWAPKRIEILSTPDADSYSMPWLKQLSAHEYRHAVQYNNLNQSTLKWLTYLLGEQGATIGLLFPPLYAIEGDAVMAETEFSTYGRGLQPSFTMAYRAMGDETANPKSVAKMQCGSYLEYIPDHYRLGYQLLSYANDKYEENVLSRTLWYSARNPYFIVPYDIALKKYYDTSTDKLIVESFTTLNSHWASYAEVEPSSQVIDEIDSKNYTTYSHPIALEDDRVLVLKSDFDTPSRFVIVDAESAEEQRLAYTGYVSSRPSLGGGRVWWSEYRRSPLFEQDVNSRLCYMDIHEGKPHTIKGCKSALYPTPINNSASHIAYVEYAIDGHYSVVELRDEKEISRHQMHYPNEIHSLAWDNLTKALYIIVTGDEGMWIERVDEDGFTPITKGAFVTISNLRAHDGVLYFGSIASGKDEVHSLDLASNKESQLTISKYGAFQPSVGDNKLFLTSYDKYGYHLAKQDLHHAEGEIQYSKTPKNILNPEYKKWNIMNLDTVRFDTVALAESMAKHKSKRYSKASHLAHVHSWLPLACNPYTLLSELILDFNYGATLVSQNLLSTCDGFLSYGWNRNYGSIWRTGVNYNGLGADISLSATYGGVQNAYYVEGVDLGKYKDIALSVSLPLVFQRGYRTRTLSPAISWNYSNGVLPKGLSQQVDANGDNYLAYKELATGVNKAAVALTYTDYVRSAYRNVDVPKALVLSAIYSLNPTNSEFSSLLSLYGKVYTPGFTRNSSFTLAAAYQNIYGGFRWNDSVPLLGYKASVLTPRGYDYNAINNSNYYAASANYQFTMCYPEISITPLLYIKRLRLNLGADYATFDGYEGGRDNIYSYGADLISDVNFISYADASTVAFKLSLYAPRDEGLYFQAGLTLPF